MSVIKEGMQAPEFCLPNQDEAEICLKDIKGRWIVLYFYPRDNTPGCTTEACDFRDANDEFSSLDAVTVGVSPDSAKSHVNFIARHNLNFMLLSDKEKTVMKAYGAFGKKQMYGKEVEGVIRSTFIIDPDGNVAKA